MPLARMILSMSQRCSSKRRTCGSPRLSMIGCGCGLGFMSILHLFCDERCALCELRPLRDLALEHGAESFRRAAEQAKAERGAPQLDIGRFQHTTDGAIDLGDNLGRRALGRIDTVPACFSDERHADFLEGRNVGQLTGA